MKKKLITNRTNWCWIFFTFILFLEQCNGLRGVRLSMPSAIQRGQTTFFICHYDLEDDTLYQVKWYKGLREFYRYTPNESPSVKVFPITGLNVNKEHSNGSHLFLGPVEVNVTGKYSCEVSADAPSFHTSLVTAETIVVEIPRHTPTISGIKNKYRLGDTLRGNCTSENSKPAANLTWFINNESPNPKYVKQYRTYNTHNHHLETSQLSIRFTINKHHFENGHLKIRCIASIYNVYWKSTEKSVDEERPKLSVNNVMPPNTLSVNQMPGPIDFNPPSDPFFDEDFPVETPTRQHHHHHQQEEQQQQQQQQQQHHYGNSITFINPGQFDSQPPFGSSSWSSTSAFLILTSALFATQML